MSDTERRSRDTKVEVDRRRGADALRTNPEVMERSEPQTETAPRQSEVPSQMSDVRTKFDQLQSEFIDDPKSAVQKAHQLMDSMLNKMRERLESTHRDVEKSDDTEKLRLAMRDYRDMLVDTSGSRRST